jgi:DNA-binding CsgD family transcriptional regulator
MHNSHGQLDEAIRLLSEGQLLNYQIAEITGLNPNTVGKLKKALAQ